MSRSHFPSRAFLFALSTAGMVSLGANAAFAGQLLDPATLFVGSGAGTTCATGTPASCQTGTATSPVNVKGEVNAIGSGDFSLSQNSGGAAALNNPVLVLLGVPNGTSGSIGASAIGSTATEYDPYPTGTQTTVKVTFGTTFYGLNTTGFVGSMTSGQDLYKFLDSITTSGDFTGMDASESFTNWQGYDYEQLGLSNITSFGIYAFAVDTSTFSGNSLLNFTWSGLPEGTFIAGYGNDSKNAYGTPFTETGVDNIPPTSVPEPGSLALFGAALFALFGLAGWRRRKN